MGSDYTTTKRTHPRLEDILCHKSPDEVKDVLKRGVSGAPPGQALDFDLSTFEYLAFYDMNEIEKYDKGVWGKAAAHASNTSCFLVRWNKNRKRLYERKRRPVHKSTFTQSSVGRVAASRNVKSLIQAIDQLEVKE